MLKNENVNKVMGFNHNWINKVDEIRKLRKNYREKNNNKIIKPVKQIADKLPEKYDWIYVLQNVDGKNMLIVYCKDPFVEIIFEYRENSFYLLMDFLGKKEIYFDHIKITKSKSETNKTCSKFFGLFATKYCKMETKMKRKRRINGRMETWEFRYIFSYKLKTEKDYELLKKYVNKKLKDIAK